MIMEVLLLGFAQSVINFLAMQLAKVAKIEQQRAFILVTVLMWAIYYAFVNYLPVEIQEQSTLFVMGTMAGAKIFYDWLKKLDVKVEEKQIEMAEEAQEESE